MGETGNGNEVIYPRKCDDMTALLQKAEAKKTLA